MNYAYRAGSASPLAGVTALIFDLDGTLIDSVRGISISLKAAFKVASREMPADNLRSVLGPPIAIIARKLEPSLTDDEVAIIEREYRADYDVNGWRVTSAFEGVVEGLRRLREAGLRLFVLTNKPWIPTEKTLEYLGINAVFEAVLTRDARLPRFTSKTEMLAELIRVYGLETTASAMLGDTDEDREAARNNEMRFVHMTYGYGRGVEADIRADRFQAIEEMLTRGNKEE